MTQLDLDVEQTIRHKLLSRTPGATIVGEEHDAVAGDSRIGWVIDPVDGTVNLVYDLPVIGVSIAATVDGHVVAGAVADVRRNEIFSAAAGRGARCDGAPIAPSTVGELADALVGTGFSYAAEARAVEAAELHHVLPAARDIRCFGSAALHLCWVACGRLDAFYQRNLKEWDVAAGAFIASEAGARVEMPGTGNGHLVLASSTTVFDSLRPLLG